MSYDNRNRGVLFKNKKKTKDTQPDYQGNINVDGIEYDLAGWKKEPKAGGDTFLSLKIDVRKENGYPSRPKPAPRREIEDDDIPF